MSLSTVPITPVTLPPTTSHYHHVEGGVGGGFFTLGNTHAPAFGHH